MIETPPQIGDDPSKEPKITRHCISAGDAQKPTLRAMINSRSPNHGPEDEAVVENGIITGSTKEDTPDGDFRNIPIEIEGTFSEKQFSFRSTIHIYVHEITTSFEGRHIGHCNGNVLGSGWRPPRIRY